MIRNNLVVLALTVTLVGCANLDRAVDKDDELYHHIVRMERDGSPRDISSGQEIHNSTFRNRQLAKIREKIQNNDALKAIVVHVHGAPILGDVSIDDSRKKMLKIRGVPTKDGYSVHPIMFNWDGSFGDVYVDRLIRIRNGQEISALRGFSTSFAYILEDIVGVVGTSLATWGSHINHVAETEYPSIDFSGEQFEAKRRQDVILHGQINSDESCKETFLISNILPNTPESSLGSLANVIRASPTIAASPLLASFGRSAWENYDRRTKLAIRKGDEFAKDGKSGNEEDDTPTGIFAVMMDAILKDINGRNQGNEAKRNDINVIMVGHSTGTMILSEYIGTLVAPSKQRKSRCGSEEHQENRISRGGG